MFYKMKKNRVWEIGEPLLLYPKNKINIIIDL